MADLEQVYQDKKAWMFFEGETDETIGVYCRCPECSKYVKRGSLLMNGLGEVKFKGFLCKVHGEIQPYYDRDCA
jgi:hypothetical protein